MVLYSHSFYLFSNERVDPLHWLSGGIYTFGNVGVYIFLTVSGYLITQSLMNSTSIFNFIWKRVIRILPALWFMVLTSVFIFGPILSEYSFYEYFNNVGSYNFLKNLFLFVPNNFKIPTVFASNHVGTYNGCLWTIVYEVFFYLMLVVFFISKLLKFKFLLLIQWLLFVVIQFKLGDEISTYSYSSPWILNLNIEKCFRLFIYFEAGVLFYLFKNILYRRYFVFIYLFNAFVISTFFHLSQLTLAFILPPLVIYLSVINDKFSFIEKYGDYSYGIYLYGYVIQQFIVSLKLKFMNEIYLFFISLVISFIFAFFSWHYVEKPMLKLKKLFK